MAALEKNLLLCILNRLRMRRSSLSEDDGRASGCSCSDTAGMAGTHDIASKTHNSSFGIFPQAQLMESSNLARRLTTGKPKEAARHYSNLGFARLQGEPHMFCSNSQHHPDVRADSLKLDATQSHTSHEPKRDPFVLTSFMKIIQQLQVVQPQHAYPDMRSLNSMRDFLRYTETEGRQLFQDLDRDKDGQVTLDDLKVAMDNMKLPLFYANKFWGRAKTHWLANSCGWSEFSSVIQQKEPTVLSLFNSLNVTRSGTLQRTQVKDLLRNAGLPATDAAATAMMSFLGVDTKGSIKYGHFRKFMLLVPTEQLAVDPWRIWFEAATLRPEANRAVLGSVISQDALFSREIMSHSEIRKKV